MSRSRSWYTVNAFIGQFKIRLTDCMKQTWHSDINESPRCDSYKEFKTLLNVERYLTLDMPFYLRKALARFRHKLSIEIGRHHNINRADRNCIYCLNQSNTMIIGGRIPRIFFSFVRNLMYFVKIICLPGTDKVIEDQGFSDCCRRHNRTLLRNSVYL